MNHFRITYKDGGTYTEENPVTGKETRREYAKIEQLDEVVNFSDKYPEHDCYSVYNNRDGSKAYYWRTVNQIAREDAIYGNVAGRWSYTCYEADKVY